MKKKGDPRRNGPPASEMPDPEEMLDVAEEAQFGDDAGHPLVWPLIYARLELLFYRDESPELPLAAALREIANRPKGRGKARLENGEFYEVLLQAIVDRDGEFFREVARLLETRCEGMERRMDFEVAHAFHRLCAQAGRTLPPTKKEVREAALFTVAFANVVRRKPSPDAYWDMHANVDSHEPLVLKPEAEQEILKEVERIPEQNWTRIFKRCGLAHLPNDKGGQRTHRARRQRPAG